MSEEAKTTRHIPEDPLLTLPTLTPRPPDFTHTEKLSRDRVALMELNKTGFLWPEEEKLLLQVLAINESAIAFTEEERGTFRQDYFSDYIIPVLPHIPWVERPIPIPPGIKSDVIAYLQDKIKAGFYEPTHSSYSSKWFCVVKKSGKLRLVHDFQRLNSITIRDAGRPPEPDDFVAQCAGSSIYSVFDLFSGYDARRLNIQSRDICSFNTPIGTYRPTGLPQGCTNAVPEFQACMSFILQPEMPNIASPFIDDIPVNGPKTRYQREDGTYETIKENPGIRRFIWEHALDVTRVLHRIKCSGATVSGHKIQLGVTDPLIVGQICTMEGRLPDPKKVSAILKWPIPVSVTEIRSFLGMCGGVRIWIKGYSSLARPLTELTRKDEVFLWTERRDKAFNTLKELVTSPPALKSIDYESDNEVILSVDTSIIAVGFHLAQVDDQGRRRIARYGSLPINERESRYSQAKLELFGVFRALRHFRIYIIGVKRLVIETDAKYIQGMLNSPDIMPNASMNRWVAGILLFQFELRHIPGREHKISDGLSRRPHAKDDEVEEDEDWLDEQLGFMIEEGTHSPSSSHRVFMIRGAKAAERRERRHDYAMEDRRIIEFKSFLEDLTIPDHVRQRDSVDEGRQDATTKFVSQAARFYLQKGAMYRRREGAMPIRIILDQDKRDRILSAAHDGIGHRGVHATRAILVKRFWWPSMHYDIDYYVASCHMCQTRSTTQVKVPITVSQPTALFQKIYVDVMFMPKSSKYMAIIAARDDLSGLSEGRALRKVSADRVADFLLTQIVYRYGCPLHIVTDNGPETRGATKRLLERHNIPQARISAYNSRANGVVERGHYTIREAIIRFCEGDVKKWPQYVDLAFFADRITTRRQTGFSPYFLAYGVDPILPMDLTEWTFQSEGFREGMTSEQLLTARMRQLARRQDDLDAAAERLLRSRWGSKERFEMEYEARLQGIDHQKGALVLVRDMSLFNTFSLTKKTAPRYLGPFVVERRTRGGSYILRELDGTLSRRGIAAFRLLPYLKRGNLEILNTPLERLGLDADTNQDVMEDL